MTALKINYKGTDKMGFTVGFYRNVTELTIDDKMGISFKFKDQHVEGKGSVKAEDYISFMVGLQDPDEYIYGLSKHKERGHKINDIDD